MSKLYFNANELKGISFFDNYIEKAKKGEQVGGSYIYRENITEKTRTNNKGQKVVTRYRYYYIKDFLKDTADKILKNIGEFFFKGNPEEVKKIEAAYTKQNIEHDYGADKKTWYQHVMEYFSHRNIWDKRFANKDNQEKFKKPIKQKVAEKINNPDMETPVEKVPEIKTSVEKEKKWKANPSLMRKIWSMYTGKDIAKDEKTVEKVEEVINEAEPKKDNGLTEEERKQIESYVKRQLPKEVKYAKENTDVVKDDDSNKLTPEQENAVKVGFPKFMGIGELKTITEFSQKGEEKEFYKNKIKELADSIIDIKNNWYKSYDEDKEKHKAGLRLFNASGSEWYITEWDGNNEAFGYAILNGDTEMAEWGYIDLQDLKDAHKSPFNQLEVDLYYDNSGYVEDQLEGNNQAITVSVLDEIMDDVENNYYSSLSQKLKDNEIPSKNSIIREIDKLNKDDMSYQDMIDVTKDEDVKNNYLKAQAQIKGHIEALQRILTELPESLNISATEEFKFNLKEQDALNNLFDEYTVDNSLSDNIYQDERYVFAQKKIMERLAKEKGIPVNQVNFSEVVHVINELYQEHGNKIAMLGNQNARKYGITENLTETNNQVHNANGGIANGENNSGIERNRLSDTNGEILTGNNQTDGGINVSTSENGSNSGESVYNDSESGIGLRGNGSGRDSRGTGTSTGRLSVKEAKIIRAKCLEILKKSDSEITEADKEILKNYEGAGGLKEGSQTDAAVLSEFYTPRDVIKKIWEIVDKYNPNKDKKVLEPSAATGRFAEGRPEKFTLCELDKTSARIAKLLHPDAEVKQGAFQQTMGFIKNNSVQKEYKGEKFDVAVGNPPYMDYNDIYSGISNEKIHKRYETYFIDKTLETLKDDGIMAFVVPSGFLRNANSKAKEEIAKKGKLIEAWRLPKGTFSSTDVGTDIIVLRKEPGKLEDFNDNKYFTDNPSHVIGTESFDGNWGSAVINLPEGKTVAEAIEMIDTKSVEVDKQIAEITQNIETKITIPNKIKTNYSYGETVETDKGNGVVTGFRKKDGKTIGYKVRLDNNEIIDLPAETDAEEHENRSNAMKGNKNAEKLIKKETVKKAKKGDVYTESVGHNMTADEFSKRFGKEVPEQDLKFWKKTNWEGIVEFNDLSENEKKEIENNKNFIKTENGYENIVNYASGNIYDKLNELELNKDNISKDEYDYKKSLLNAAKPVKKTVEQFTVSPLSNFSKTFVDEEGKNLVDKFLFDYLGFNSYGSDWGIKISKNELDDNLKWSDIWDYIHQKPVQTERARGWNKEDKEAEAETNKMIANQKKVSRREVAERLFNDFLRKLPKEDKEKVESAWNKQFNAIVNPDFKKIPLFVEGLNTHKGKKEFDPTDQQIKGISELCNKGNGILAYDVGVGKTFCGIVATVNQLETGKAKKPLIMVPKAVYKKWIKEIHQHFPNINVNELGNFSEKDIGKYKNADGTYNFPENSINVCTYEALQKVTFKDETLEGDLKDDMLDSQSIYDYDENGNLVEDTRTDREKAKEKERVMKLLGKSASAKDGAVYWEDLGIDHITVDELHNFKNVFSIPSTIGKSNRFTKERKTDYWGHTVKEDGDGRLANEFQGLSGASSSRGMKMFAISQLIQRQNDGRGFFGLSATPFNNSPVEIYNILSLCARNRLKDLNIYNLQDFLREFAELKPDFKINAKGEAVESQTMKNFKNLGALQNLITEFIDKVDGEEAGVIRPRKQLHMPELDLTPLQKQIMEVEKMRMDGRFSTSKENSGDVLVAMNNMRMAVLSPSLIDPKFYADYMSVYDNFTPPSPDDVVKESPKLQFVCDSVVKQWKERPSESQVIYMPRGVGKKAKANDEDVSYGDKVNGFQAMKDYLVSKGMPEDSIAFMNSDTSLDMKEQIKDDFNNPDGKIKVIIGSETIKEGVSLNGNATTLYNTMLGWNPTETIQVEGRIWRQGNKQGITHIVYPLMNDSIDAMMYQKYDEKSSRLNALWSYKGDSLNVEDYNPEEVKYELIKDPEKRANMKIMFEQKELKRNLRMENARYDNLYDTKQQYDRLNNHIESYNNDLKNAQDNVNSKQASLEDAKAEIEKCKKTVATAKKANDKDLIEMANTKLENANNVFENAKMNLTRAKDNLKFQERNIKELNGKIEGIKLYWDKQGVENNNVDSKLEEISTKRQQIESDLNDIKNKREEYIAEARKQLEEEKSKQKHNTVDQVVNMTTKEISDNLRLMDDSLRAEIRAELEERFPYLKKSLPLFFIHEGRFLIRK